MKIVTYNLHCGGKRGAGNHWEKLLNELAPDLVLAQETLDPAEYFPADAFSQRAQAAVWSPVPAKWGSAVLATGYNLTETAIPGFEGWVAGARMPHFSMGNEPSRPLSIFSLHTPSPGPYEQKVHEILDRIRDVAGGGDILIAGDFNITTAVRHPSEALCNTAAELGILKRLRTEFGLVNAWQAAHPNQSLPQTLRWSGNRDNPYHCDAIFIPLSWVRYLEKCEILAGGWASMSDHNPIMATFT